MSVRSFYGSGSGDLLVDSSRYPEEVDSYLDAEATELSSLAFRTLIEVGCMEGRYLDWAVNNGKSYLGVDVIERYVLSGQDRIASFGLPSSDYRIEVCDAAHLHELPRKWVGTRQDSLALFPFNSFGNMEQPLSVLESLRDSRFPFLISSYQTSERANKARAEYYSNCGYTGISCESGDTGVRFVSGDGLDTIAYHPQYLGQLLEELGFRKKMIELSSIGIAYIGISYDS